MKNTKSGFTLWSADERKRGFTLIEMLVAVVIFIIVFLIAASFVNLASGSTKSTRTKLLTGNVRSALDVILQKLSNANGKTEIEGTMVYGFTAQNDILAVVSDTGGDIDCTFIKKWDPPAAGYPGTNYGIYMRTNDCNWPDFSVQNDPNNKNHELTNPNTLNITGLTFTPVDVMTNQDPTRAPYLKVNIEAHDPDPKYQEDNRITLQTSFTMDYETIERLKK